MRHGGTRQPNAATERASCQTGASPPLSTWIVLGTTLVINELPYQLKSDIFAGDTSLTLDTFQVFSLVTKEEGRQVLNS